MSPTVLAIALVSTSLVHASETLSTGNSTVDTSIAREVVVTANKVPTDLDKVATSVTVITSEDLQLKQKTLVADVLREVSGLDVARAGGPGRTTSVFIRGAKSEHTLVLIDGVPANDPMSIGRAFDFGTLATSNVERIEILRGAQSVMYGTDAIGGVINIITKKGRGGPLGGSIEAGYGAAGSDGLGAYRVAAHVGGTTRALQYSLGGSFENDQSLSSADDSVTTTTDRDAYRNLTVSGAVQATPIDKLNLSASSRYTNSKFDLDASGGDLGEDPNFKGTSASVYSKVSASSNHVSFWEPILSFSHSNVQRTSDNLPDFKSTSESHTTYDSYRLKPEIQSNFYVDEAHTFSVGADLQQETGSSKEDFGFGVTEIKNKSASTQGVWAQHQLQTDSFFSSEGIRLDHHDVYGSRGTYRVAPGYRIAATGTTFKGTIGTGFKAPSLYQLHSSFGNPVLLPERSLSMDGGFEQELLSKDNVVGVTYFENQYTNLIDFDLATFNYQNIGKARSRGVEVQSKNALTRSLQFNAGWTYTLAQDETTRLQMLRRPKHKGSADLLYRRGDLWNAGLSAQVVGTRPDIHATNFSRIEMSSYTVLNLSGTYSIQRDFDIFGRLDNVTNRKYQEIHGYRTAGISLFTGIRKAF